MTLLHRVALRQQQFPQDALRSQSISPIRLIKDGEVLRGTKILLIQTQGLKLRYQSSHTPNVRTDAVQSSSEAKELVLV